MKEQRRRGRIGGVVRTGAAFAVGAALGAIVSLFYAPASGQITRKRLVLRMRNLRRETGRNLGRTRRAFEAQARQVRIAAREWLDERLHHNGRQQVRRPVRHAHAS